MEGEEGRQTTSSSSSSLVSLAERAQTKPHVIRIRSIDPPNDLYMLRWISSTRRVQTDEPENKDSTKLRCIE